MRTVGGMRSLRYRKASIVAAAALVAVALAAPAFAQDGGRDVDLADQIVLTGRLIVPSGESVDAAVIFDGDALVEGTVRESLVVLTVTPRSRAP